MVDVKNKKCEYSGCHLQPQYGLENGKVSHCAEHKEASMVDLTHKRCEKCIKRARFGVKGEKVKYCADHKETEMVD